MYYQFKKKQTIIFSSGELAQLLSVTTQTIMNYRKRGMPYHHITSIGYYKYDFEAIQWVFDNGYKISKSTRLPLGYKIQMFELSIAYKSLEVENKRLKSLLDKNDLP